MNKIQKTFATNMKTSLLAEIEELRSEMANPKARPTKNKQRAKAIEDKLEAIRQCDITMGCE